MKNTWQFWIDVGGTFTDCLALTPQGDEHFTKVLSSGITKGKVRTRVDQNAFVDPNRIGDGDDFWMGARLRFMSSQGSVSHEATVTEFDSGPGLIRIDGVMPESPNVYELDGDVPAPVLAMHRMQGIPLAQPLEDSYVDLSTTRGTNALLTRSGAKTGLVTSSGLRDFLIIGDQARPRLFELAVRKRKPLFASSIEIGERVLFDGTVEQEPRPDEVRESLQKLRAEGIESLAICLMFGYRFPQHEQIVAKIAREVGFESICCSSDVAPVIRIIPRGETTVLDAYLNPVILGYLNDIQSFLSPRSRLRMMTSAGGLVSRDRFSGKDSVLSGPAGGVVGAARVAQQCGFDRVIGFDMGGTSTDVSRFEGKFEKSYETYKASVRIVSPMLEIETVAAGGGSICWFDGTKLCVGPESAGADPGPACYGRGGPLAMTDINLFLGRIQVERFPFELDLKAVENRLDEVLEGLGTAGHEYTRPTLAAGFLRIANQHMASAIQTVSVAKGYDPQDYVLMSFGGAGSQHCCAVAENLKVRTIIDHPQSSILSAVGIRLADQTVNLVQAVSKPLSDETLSTLSEVLDGIANDAVGQLTEETGFPPAKVRTRYSLDTRYQGTDACLAVDLGARQAAKRHTSVAGLAESLEVQSVSPEALATSAMAGQNSTAACLPEMGNSETIREAFERQHRQFFGYIMQRPLEIIAARVEATVPGNRLMPLDKPESFKARTANQQQSVYSHDVLTTAEYFDRHQLVAGDLIVGPAMIADDHSTTVVDTGWNAKVLADGVIQMEQQFVRSPHRPTSPTPHPPTSPAPVDPVQLEIFNSHFAGIASQMGESLRRTSVSVNVKERLDFSCAIFTADGDLVVNAPHIPVHLGAMSETVRNTIALNPKIRPGDVFVTNDPYAGGSHLPDVTVLTPVFVSEHVYDTHPLGGLDALASGEGRVAAGEGSGDSTLAQNAPSPLVPRDPPKGRVDAGLGVSPKGRAAFRVAPKGGAESRQGDPSEGRVEFGVVGIDSGSAHHQPDFWVASRSHHAEIGGMAPGSMPAAAMCLEQEGVLIQNFKVIAGGQERFDELSKILTSGSYPSRAPEENIADVQAQVAANQTGIQGVWDLVDRYSLPVVSAYMQHIQSAAEQQARDALSRLPDGESRFEDSMDTGATIRVRLKKKKDELEIDFGGTDPVQPDNLNANRAIVSSAVMYVMRLLIDRDIPLNEGVLKPVTIQIPECFLNPISESGNSQARRQFAPDSPTSRPPQLPTPPTPHPPISPPPDLPTSPPQKPAIVGGNVETSQRIVDVLLGALGIAAASQGTMNNWLMGGDAFGYYETVGGGTGAMAERTGADAVHSHMTNTRLTDPEVLETRYGVVLREFAVREGSGGEGRHSGGDGMIREIEFRRPMTVSLLTSRRKSQPYGMMGGEPGAAGVNTIIRAGGKKEELPGRYELLVQPGDRLRIETPGGGGFGELRAES